MDIYFTLCLCMALRQEGHGHEYNGRQEQSPGIALENRHEIRRCDGVKLLGDGEAY